MNVLVLGASYGLLPAVRIHLAGHRVCVVCRNDEKSALSSNGARVTFLRRTGAPDISFDVGAVVGTDQAGHLRLEGVELDLAPFDIVFLAMTEPQCGSPEVATLLRRIARAKLPVVSLMNALPPPFLRRLSTIDVDALRPAYAAWNVWQDMDPQFITAASPDAQAVRTDPDRPNELTVTLASNFKAAPFARPEHQGLLETLAQDVAAYRRQGRPLPVRLIAHPSVYVPIVKWPMLMAGNCRCVRSDGSIVSISEAVTADLDASRRMYDRTLEIVAAAGAGERETVPFDHYARAARSLTRPSSFARALATGAAKVERVDKIIQLSGQQLGIDVAEITGIVDQVDRMLARAI